MAARHRKMGELPKTKRERDYVASSTYVDDNTLHDPLRCRGHQQDNTDRKRNSVARLFIGICLQTSFAAMPIKQNATLLQVCLVGVVLHCLGIANGAAVAEIPLKIKHNYLGNPPPQVRIAPNGNYAKYDSGILPRNL